MKRIYGFIVAALFVTTLCACSKDTMIIPDERTPGIKAEYSGSEFVTVAEGENMRLQLRPDNGTIRWQDKKTGEYFDTKQFEGGLTNAGVLSDVILNYFSGARENVLNTYASMDSYTYAVKAGTMSFEEIPNGVRIVYEISDDKIEYKDFPAKITAERMQEFVIQHITDIEYNTILMQNYNITADGSYVRRSSSANPLAGMGRQQLWDVFYVKGTYNYDELIADHIAANVLEEDYPTSQTMVAAVDYYLDGDDMLVSVPVGEITFDKNYPLKSIDLLPYFLSAKDGEADGYLFVPDGSGALIYLDNSRKTEYQFTAKYFGGDILQGPQVYQANDIVMACPVFGIKKGDRAVLGIIEEGAEAATLNAYVSGYYAGIPYSRLSLTFAVREEQIISNLTNEFNTFRTVRTPSDSYKDDIQIRYRYLTGNDADYSGMAKAYQSYLLDRGALAENEPEEDAPLFVEFLGAIDKRKYFLGIPYKGTETLTTFQGAQDILARLDSQGVHNINVELAGIVNGGLNQRAVNAGVSVEGSVGGKKGLASFTDYAASIGAKVFPKISLQTASTDKHLSKSQLAFQLNGTQAQILQLNRITGLTDLKEEYAEYIVSPKYIEAYVQKFMKSYEKLGINTLASGDFLTFISGDYRKKNDISMTTALPHYANALASLKESGYSLLLSNPVYLAYGSVGYLTDIPVESSLLKIEDASVPFLQMVLDGYVAYSSKKLNNSTYDLTEDLMKAIETKSALKFLFISEDITALQSTRADNVFMADYPAWDALVSRYYQEYNAFYQQVKDAVITKHEIVGRNNNHIVVTYSNGIKVYLNYGGEEADIGGVSVPAYRYQIQRGGSNE